ncbi:MAG: hypothetical protein GY870_20430, partial [archaeon]|nr:hypothetical protein [archaeon]
LYWQINDCWQVASWSSLDYFGRWKALQYIAKRVYQPLFASVKEEKKSVELWITNDLRKSCKVTLNWKILNSESKLLMNGSKNVTILPCSSYKVETVDASIINKTKIKRQNNIIFFSLIDDNSGKSIYHGFRLFSNPKTFKLKDPKLSWGIERIYSKNKDKNQKENEERHEEGIEQSYQMKIKANSIALYVYLESDNFDFIASDNYFSLESGESRIIEFRIEPLGNKDEKIEEKEIIKTIKVGSLYNLMK